MRGPRLVKLVSDCTNGVVLVSLLLTLDISWHRSGVFIGNFEHISHLVLVFALLTLSR